MDIWHIIVLALIQGITEFLPISSSAHLILLPALTTWEDQGLAFDVALHVGSLIAVLMYFRQELGKLTSSWIDSLKTRQLTPESRLVWGVGLGTIPVGIVGLFMASSNLEAQLRTPVIIAITTIVFGLLLWVADVMGKRERDEFSLTGWDILIIGLAQALALIPGTSRSGITMTAALLLGIQRKAAARFSFLLSIPVIILAGISETVQLIHQQTTEVAWLALIFGATLSAIVAYLCIHTFMALLDRIGMLPFVLYRLLLGVFLFTLI